MARILFLVHRIPYPPNKGDKIRYWNFFSRLAADEKNTLHLGFFVDDPEDMEHVETLSQMAQTVCHEFMSPLGQKIRSLSGLLTGRSLTEAAYPSTKMRRYVSNLVDNNEIDLIYIASAAPFSWLPDSLRNIPVISDLADVDSQKWHAYAQKASWPLSWLYNREARTLLDFEREIAAKSTKTIFVTEDEASLFRELCGNEAIASNVLGLKNGVDTASFDPSRYEQAERQADGGLRLIFCGAMNYQPNVEAVTWFAEHAFPLVRQAFENASFIIAGRPVAGAVEKLASIEGITVTGAVPDMAEEISKSHIVVAPLHTARGIQNKVLEGMAMAKPVIATAMANEGINAVDGKEILVAETPDEYLSAIKAVLSSSDGGRSIGEQARAFVQQNFSWENSQRELNTIIDQTQAKSGVQHE